MKPNCKISAHFKLNCWKHHAGFIKNQIAKVNNEEKIKVISSIVKIVGESQMDLYCGKLTPIEITSFIAKILKSDNAYKYSAYKLWLGSKGKDYRLITLPDKSVWALRMGNEKENYIHIHPGRYTEHTIRVRALTLKTTICILAHMNCYKIPSSDLQLVNIVRMNFLKAPPVKSLSSISGLKKLLKVFKNL